MIKLILILILIILIIIIFKLTTDIKYYDYGYPFANKKVCFVGSVHGNEPAGCVALTALINSDYFKTQKNIFIRVIPCVNIWGLTYNSRYQLNPLHPDINRNFAEKPLDPVSAQIAKLISGMDWVIDIHEGYDYHLINPSSVGSTLSPSTHPEAQQMAQFMVQKINETIPDAHKKFTVLYDNSCKIKKTLACFRKSQNKKYILIEITGQDDIQPINQRSDQTIILIKEFLRRLTI